MTSQMNNNNKNKKRSTLKVFMFGDSVLFDPPIFFRVPCLPPVSLLHIISCHGNLCRYTL